jgi:proteasome lid subunit RPN8/RPN11
VKLLLPQALAVQILAEARDAAPRECCGLILGRRHDTAAVATSLTPARNLSDAADRFEIAPEDHFAALRAARAAGQAVIGCYHSHPHGNARPSARDLAGAGEEGFLWLIATTGGELAAFVYLRGRMEGADLVTSSS